LELSRLSFESGDAAKANNLEALRSAQISLASLDFEDVFVYYRDFFNKYIEKMSAEGVDDVDIDFSINKINDLLKALEDIHSLACESVNDMYKEQQEKIDRKKKIESLM
jgi:hypothetical protein